MQSFGKRLRELRLEKDMTQRDLADRVGLDFTYISKMESGGSPPPAEEKIEGLARALEADKDELLRLARRVPEDIVEAILADERVPRFLRTIGNLSEETREVIFRMAEVTRNEAKREDREKP